MLSLLLRGLVMCLIIVFISVQMIHPLLRNSEPAVVARDMPKLLERLIKLALPAASLTRGPPAAGGGASHGPRPL